MKSDLRKALEQEFKLGKQAAYEELSENVLFAQQQADYDYNRAMQTIESVEDLRAMIFDLATTSANLLVGGPQNNSALIAIDRIMRSAIWGELGRKLQIGEYS